MAHFGEILKAYRIKEDMSQTQMANYLEVGFRTYQDMEKTGLIKKSDVLKRIKDKTGLDMQISAHPTKEPVKKEKAKETNGLDLNQQILADLVHSNKNLSESNKSLSRSHEDLVGMVKKDSSLEEDQHTMEETVALVIAMREYLVELAADVKKVSPVEISQVLHKKVKDAKEKGGKMGSRTASGK